MEIIGARAVSAEAKDGRNPKDKAHDDPPSINRRDMLDIDSPADVFVKTSPTRGFCTILHSALRTLGRDSHGRQAPAFARPA